jgi:tungstate transport system ATP-binding protein
MGQTVPLAVQREITLVFQRPLVLDTSVERNIAYPLRLRGQHDNERVGHMLSLFGLEHLAQARARTLSGGEMQRVALARAMVMRPRVLLLDEPTANLDRHNVALIERALLELRAEYALTLVVATHNLHQAQRLASHTALLLDGELIEQGDTEQVLEQGRDERTRAFVNGGLVY